MEFSIKRDVLLKSLGFIQGIVEKKNTLPKLSNAVKSTNKKLAIQQTRSLQFKKHEARSSKHKKLANRNQEASEVHR